MRMKFLGMAAAFGFVAANALAADIDTVATANNEFGFDLLRSLKDNPENKGKNQFISPISIHTAFGMALTGARTETRDELIQSLRFPTGFALADLNAAYKDIQDDLRGTTATDGFELAIANHFWAQSGFGFLPDYLSDLDSYFDAGVGEYDFRDEADRKLAIADINQWASDNTNGRIPSIVNEESVTRNTRFVLTNAVYFLGEWVKPFPRDDKAPLPQLPFHSYDGIERKSPFLNDIRHVPYYADQDLQAIELQYKGKGGAQAEYSMLVVLPAEGSDIDDRLEKLNDAAVRDILAGMDYKEVAVTLPAFEVNAEYYLGKPLQDDLGMELAFSDYADFSGMNGRKDIKIGEVIHKTFVRVDNKGTEAAAVTAIIGIEATSVDVSVPVPFTADRPFFYAIVHRPTKTVTFAGVLLQPEGNVK